MQSELGNTLGIERVLTDIALAIRSSASIAEATGVVMQFAGATAPQGYLLCDGASVSRSIYSTLFSVIGTAYGAGDGSTTFNVPNMKGRVPVGLDSADADFNTLGKTGGAKTHTLAESQIPPHAHTLGAPQAGAGTWTGFTYNAAAINGVNVNTMATGSTGGGQPHNNLQPYLSLNYIIKI